MVRNSTGKHNTLPSTHKLNGEAWAAPAFVCAAMKNTAFEQVKGRESPYHREGKTTPRCTVIVPSTCGSQAGSANQYFVPGL